jgi:hypothetical protein
MKYCWNLVHITETSWQFEIRRNSYCISYENYIASIYQSVMGILLKLN